MGFCMKIAGHTGAVHAMFESTPLYFQRYQTQDPPEFSVTTTREDIAFEQADLLEEAHREGFKVRIFTDPFLERAAIQRQFAEYLFDFDTLLFHGSAIAVDGKGYVFTANSGTGKSTHTRLWREVFGDRAVIVNDDKPFLQLADGQVRLHGSPWSGKHGLDSNISVPLQGICILERGKENHIRAVSREEVLPMLLKQSYQPMEQARKTRFAELVDRLSQSVALWHMTCNKEREAAMVAHHSMAKNL